MHERLAEFAWAASGSTAAEEAVARASALGFDTILVSDADPHDGTLTAMHAACAAQGMALWVVLTPDAVGAPAVDAQAAPALDPWLVDDEAALDPRRPPGSVRRGPVAVAALDPGAWRATVDSRVAAGVTGFVVRDADRLPAAFWKSLIAEGAKVTWVAWASGLAVGELGALLDSGFGMVSRTVASWEGRGRGLVDEAERLPGTARVLAAPADPWLPSSFGLPDIVRLHVAAFIADALLVPQSLWSDASVADDVIAVTGRFREQVPAREAAGALQLLSAPGSPVTIVVRSAPRDLRAAARVEVLLLNPDPHRPARLSGATVTTLLSGFGDFTEAGKDARLDACSTLELAPHAVRRIDARRLPVIQRAVPSGRRSTEVALQMPRLAIEAVVPSVNDGRFPAKRTAGELVTVGADVIIDGHEKLAASLLYRSAGERDWKQVRMEPVGNDRFVARFALQRIGRHEYTIEAWRDTFATYRYELDKKAAAGLDVTLELTEGRLIVEQALAHAKTIRRPDIVKRLDGVIRILSGGAAGANPERVAALLASQTLRDMQDADHRAFAYRLETIYPIDAERGEASFASWYELFPRSLGNPPGVEATHHGTFADVIDRLPAVRDMGFDVLYFPPVHPIGRANRKGRNNSLTPTDDDPGSPYAIGSADGGHDALHPQLGTFDDFRRLREAALEHGLELALDFAIQCSPDHPWLQQHPGWFAWRPDGSLRYAENPPKKYEDIVNVDFYGGEAVRGSRNDPAPALWAALRDVVLLWVEQGVRIFRVDNPHTKPLPFWEWMIGEVRAKHPDVIFLSEAFTRPKVMYQLAKVGFSQSYTYFTWRHTKQEFVDYLTELTGPHSTESLAGAPRDFFRPNFFVNTPDINPVFLQRSGRAGFLIRAALAATLSGLWGVYSGFELCEATPVPGKEDYLDSEKYQLRAWDWRRPGHIIDEITALNRIRRENPALRTHLNVIFENAADGNILYFMKATADRSNVLLTAINLDPHTAHETDFELPLWRWGLADDAVVEGTDLLDGHRFHWQGKQQHVRLDPSHNPYAIWRVDVATRGEPVPSSPP